MAFKSLASKKLIEACIVGFVLVLFLAISMAAVFRSTPTADEPAHISAGYGYMAYGDARLNIEHPPLLKAISASITTNIKSISFPKTTFSEIKSNFWGVQWQAGSDYIYAEGNSPTLVLFFSRLPMAIIACLLGVVVYLWGKKLYGFKGGLLALIFYCFSPSILGHAPLITTDIGVTFGFIVTLFSYSTFLQETDRKRKYFWAIMSICSLSFLFLAKFSALLILPVLFIMPAIQIFFYKDKYLDLRTKILGLVRQLLVLSAFVFASLIITYLTYAYFMRGMPVDIYKKEIGEVFFNDRFGLNNLISNLPAFLRPVGYYLTGFAYVAKHSVNGHLSYFMGNLSVKGVWYYFPVVYFLKTQLIWWGALLLTLGLFIKNKKICFDELVIIIFAAVYMASSMKASLNIGIRHIFPVVVLLFILSAKVVGIWENKKNINNVFIFFLAFAYMVPTIINYPSYISYTNMLVPKDFKYKYFGDSSLDWGQDLYRLKVYVEKNNIEDLRVDYFGGNIPVGYYLPKAELWSGKNGVPSQGYIAISTTHLQFAKRYGEIGAKYYDYFINKTPIKQIGGGSILIYKVQ